MPGGAARCWRWLGLQSCDPGSPSSARVSTKPPAKTCSRKAWSLVFKCGLEVGVMRRHNTKPKRSYEPALCPHKDGNQRCWRNPQSCSWYSGRTPGLGGSMSVGCNRTRGGAIFSRSLLNLVRRQTPELLDRKGPCRTWHAMWLRGLEAVIQGLAVMVLPSPTNHDVTLSDSLDPMYSPGKRSDSSR